MIFGKAYILGLDVWKTHDTTRLPDVWKNATVVQGPVLTKLHPMSGRAVGHVDVRQLQHPKPNYWDDKVKTMHLLFPQYSDKYVLWVSLSQLYPDVVASLAEDSAHSPSRFDKDLDDLLGSTFPPLSGERVRVDRFPSFAALLYLEPEPPLSESPRELKERMSTTSSQVTSFFSLSDKTTLPYLVDGSLLLTGFRPYSLEFDCIIVNLNPATVAGSKEPQLVTTAFDVLKYMTVLRVLRHLGGKLERSPFCTHTLREYVKDVTEGEGLLAGYSKVFLRDREHFGLERHSIKRTAEKFLYDFKYSPLGAALEHGATATTDLRYAGKDVEEYYHRTEDYLRMELHRCDVDVRSFLELHEANERAIADYLRDAVAAEATRANLKLQRSVRLFTVIMVVIGILGLVFGLVGRADLVLFVLRFLSAL
jgi:hypothetical protein